MHYNIHRLYDNFCCIIADYLHCLSTGSNLQYIVSKWSPPMGHLRTYRPHPHKYLWLHHKSTGLSYGWSFVYDQNVCCSSAGVLFFHCQILTLSLWTLQFHRGTSMQKYNWGMRKYEEHQIIRCHLSTHWTVWHHFINTFNLFVQNHWTLWVWAVRHSPLLIIQNARNIVTNKMF